VLIYSPREVESHIAAAIKAVGQYRAHHKLTLPKLAAHMRAAGCEVPARTLLDLFAYDDAIKANETPRHRPRYLTKLNIVRFHFHLKETRKRAAAIRRRRRGVTLPSERIYVDDFAGRAVANDKA
jgi:hypothetical protein